MTAMGNRGEIVGLDQSLEMVAEQTAALAAGRQALSRSILTAAEGQPDVVTTAKIIDGVRMSGHMVTEQQVDRTRRLIGNMTDTLRPGGKYAIVRMTNPGQVVWAGELEADFLRPRVYLYGDRDEEVSASIAYREKPNVFEPIGLFTEVVSTYHATITKPPVPLLLDLFGSKSFTTEKAGIFAAVAPEPKLALSLEDADFERSMDVALSRAAREEDLGDAVPILESTIGALSRIGLGVPQFRAHVEDMKPGERQKLLGNVVSYLVKQELSLRGQGGNHLGAYFRTRKLLVTEEYWKLCDLGSEIVGQVYVEVGEYRGHTLRPRNVHRVWPAERRG